MDFLANLSKLDRRWVFLFVAVSVVIPLLVPLNLPIRESAEVTSFYNVIEKLPEGSTVLISADYDPTAKPELYPMHQAVMRLCAQKKHRMICMALWPVGASLTDSVISEIAVGEYNLKEGVDYVNLGFMAGNLVVIKGVGKSFEDTFGTAGGRPFSEVPILRGVTNLSNIDVVVNISAGFPGLPEWVQIAHDQFGATVVGGCTAVSAPQIYPYYPDQLSGLLGGLKGAAELEKLIGVPGTATSGMDAQSIVHVVIMLLVVLGNVSFFIQKSREKQY